VATQNANGVVDVACINRIALLQKTVELAQDLTGELHLQRIAFDFQRDTAHADLYLQRLLENFYVLVVLPQEIAKQSWIVKVEHVDADFSHPAGELLFFVFHSRSPMSWTTIS